MEAQAGPDRVLAIALTDWDLCKAAPGRATTDARSKLDFGDF